MNLRSSRNKEIKPPRTILEMPNVFEDKTVSDLIRSLKKVKFKQKNINKTPDWGTFWCTKKSIPKIWVEKMRTVVQNCVYIKSKLQEGDEESYLADHFIHRMTGNDNLVERRASSQMAWHTDGTTEDHPLISIIYTIYNEKTDSMNDPSGTTLGGGVVLSAFDDGRLTLAGGEKDNTAKSSTTTTYFPRTNSCYIIPGYFVHHCVQRIMDENTVRYSYVQFLRLKRTIKNKRTQEVISMNHYLRREWSLANGKNCTFYCKLCWKSYRSERALNDHKRHVKACGKKDTIKNA